MSVLSAWLLIGDCSMNDIIISLFGENKELDLENQ